MSTNEEESTRECSEKSDFYNKGKFYWRQVDASIDGMLGGFSNVNVMDADESRGLLKKLLKQQQQQEAELDNASNLRRVLDCGAGIGRVSKYVLSHFFDEIHLLDQNESFLAQSKSYMGDKYSKVKHTFAQGIQDFQPLPEVKYDCIWIQWVVGYVTDKDLVQFLQKCAQILKQPDGFIVIKDNVTKSKESIVDEEDGSVTRSEDAIRNVFQQVSQLTIKCIVKQKMPKGLYPVRMYVLTLKI